MFEFSICNQSDKEVFQKQCVALEKYIPNIIKGEMLNDVDGSETQIYYKDDKQITVHNSKYENEVFIKSEIDIRKYFSK